MSAVRFTIPGRLPGLNEYTSKCRSGWKAGNAMKQAAEGKVIAAALEARTPRLSPKAAVFMRYTWVEKNRKRDLDNISSFGRKVIQDALVKAGTLPGDGWKYIRGFEDRFEVDRENPRIEVEIWETIDETDM